MTTSTSSSKTYELTKEQRAIVHRLIADQYVKLGDEIARKKEEMAEIWDLVDVLGPLYEPEDVAFNSRCY